MVITAWLLIYCYKDRIVTYGGWTV